MLKPPCIKPPAGRCTDQFPDRHHHPSGCHGSGGKGASRGASGHRHWIAGGVGALDAAGAGAGRFCGRDATGNQIFSCTIPNVSHGLTWQITNEFLFSQAVEVDLGVRCSRCWRQTIYSHVRIGEHEFCWGCRMGSKLKAERGVLVHNFPSDKMQKWLDAVETCA